MGGGNPAPKTPPTAGLPHLEVPAAAPPKPKLSEREQKAQAVVAEARKHINSGAWSYSADRPPYPSGTNKCNLFVFETLNAAGTPVPMNVRFSWSRFGNVKYPPLAGQWADPSANIPGWVVVKDPQPGDVRSE